MKRFRIKKVLMVLIIGIAAVLVFGFVVMGLWNAILPAVLGVKTISFMQALGILLLSKILFGGFSGGRRGPSHQWKQQMQEKWGVMSPEERENFKAEWKNRCGGMRWRPKQQDAGAAE